MSRSRTGRHIRSQRTKWQRKAKPIGCFQKYEILPVRPATVAVCQFIHLRVDYYHYYSTFSCDIQGGFLGLNVTGELNVGDESEIKKEKWCI